MEVLVLGVDVSGETSAVPLGVLVLGVEVWVETFVGPLGV